MVSILIRGCKREIAILSAPDPQGNEMSSIQDGYALFNLTGINYILIRRGC